MNETNNQQQITHASHTKILYLLVALVVVVLIAYLISGSTYFGSRTASGPSLALTPRSQSVPVGTTFTVDVMLNTAGMDIYGVDINKLNFNPQVLQVVDVDMEALGTQIAPGSLMPTTVMNAVSGEGSIQFSQIANPTIPYNGTGVIATITFKVIAEGTSPVTIDFTPKSSTDSNIASAEGDILSAVGDGSYVGVK